MHQIIKIASAFFSAEDSADLNLDEMITGQEGLKKIRAVLWETLNGQ